MRISFPALLAATLLLTACGAESEPTADGTTAETASTAPSSSPTSSPSATPSQPSALARWKSAYAFLKKQHKSTEVYCWHTRTQKPTEFYSLDADGPKWRPFLGYRDEPKFEAQEKKCAILIPSRLPYTTEAIEGFLNPLGFWFMAGSSRSDLKHVEIAYSGDLPGDPDRQFRKTPGLFGLKLSLTDKDLNFDEGIPAPRNETTATRWLAQAEPVLAWYGFTGS